MISVQAAAGGRVRNIGPIVLAALLTVGLSPRSSWALEDQAAKPVKKEDAKAQEFRLLVVGPDGKPVPNADVELRGSARLTEAGQIRVGTFVKKRNYGTAVKADAEGRLSVALKAPPTAWIVSIITPGFGPYWAEWSTETQGEAIPLEFTAQLDGGWSVGGTVLDFEGKPIPKATVHPSIEFKKRPGYNRQLGVGNTVQTDDQGKWRFDSVPISLPSVQVGIDHASFKPFRSPLTRSEYGIEKGREPSAKIVLDRGLTVVGKVTDEAGKPIAGAVVKTQFINEPREATTNVDGTYKISGCETQPARIVVFAKGYATDLKALNAEPGMGPVDFVMKPGKTVRLRVLDHKGKPIPKARVFFQTWRGQHAYFELRHVNQYTDKDGTWVWNEAPIDEFQADISPPEGMPLNRQPITARAEEYVFRIPPPLIISGKVIDAETKKPITKFRAVPGIRWNADSLHWERNDAYEAVDGQYRIERRRNDGTHLIRIEAEGYRAEISRDVRSDEGSVSLDFALKPGKGIIAKVVTPRNQPAASAKVAVGIAGSQIIIKNGDFDEVSTYCPRVTTDETGRFTLETQDKPFELVIVHSTGYAHIKSDPEWDRARIIRLEPWARVEGTFRVGKALAPNKVLEVHTPGLQSFDRDTAHLFTEHEAVTGPDGRFVFDRVVPGKGHIGRRIVMMVNTGATEVASSCRMPINLTGGETTKIDLGGTGRAIVGKLAPPEKFQGKVQWNLMHVSGQRERDGNGLLPAVYFWASLNKDGGFRVDDVPPGRYQLTASSSGDPIGQLAGQFVEVPAEEEIKETPPIELGTLELK